MRIDQRPKRGGFFTPRLAPPPVFILRPRPGPPRFFKVFLLTILTQRPQRRGFFTPRLAPPRL
jgi:hypothetical protein